MQEFYVETQAQLAAVAELLEHSEWLAVDTEFVRESTYFPKFCLMQVANESVAACIDPLAIDDLSDLTTLLFNQHIVKVFHAARQDLEIFYHQWQKLPQPIFDTQLAATLTGLGDQPGYAATVKKVLGIELDKTQVRTDWSRRPLDASQRRYALNDVIYLGQLYQLVKQKLVSLDRDNWLDGDLVSLTDTSTYQIDPDEQWKRVRGKNALRARQRIVLKYLAAWREARAVQKNKPRKWILSDEILLTLAKRAPTSVSKLTQIRGLDSQLIANFGKTLVTLIREATETAPDTWPQVENANLRLSLQQEALADLLMCALRTRADEENISPSVIGSRRDIEKLVTGQRRLALLTGWRRKVVGKDLLRMLAGEFHVGVKEDAVKLIPAD